ncbi:hypothetical protein RND81_02G220500 [Saponaria officinalis]|uniref:Uncharacterized protein n=1 Tax=Saponaria officinalis TaxID=3572 RepID=A0AAW1MVY9_SAPOF
MVLSNHKAFILLLCIGILAIKPHRICSLRRENLVLGQTSGGEQLVSANRVLHEASKQEFNTNRESAPTNKKFDPTQSSDRRVQRGSDPIHNRS